MAWSEEATQVRDRANRLDRRCYTCRYWKPIGDAEELGRCLGVRPAVAWSEAFGRAMTFWPKTEAEDHCPGWEIERRPENRKASDG